jgi:hypothetical protein
MSLMGACQAGYERQGENRTNLLRGTKKWSCLLDLHDLLQMGERKAA